MTMTIGDYLQKISLEKDEREKAKEIDEVSMLIDQHVEKKLLEAFLIYAIQGKQRYNVGRMLVPDSLLEENIKFIIEGAGWVACW